MFFEESARVGFTTYREFDMLLFDMLLDRVGP